MKEKLSLIIAGAVTGILAIVLVWQGNPLNMGFCIACFLRDITGGLGLHRAAVVQYLRPEVIGLVLGSFFVAIYFKDFKSSGGSNPVVRFILGMVMMFGALVFLGCPLRMLLRIAGGDLNALVGLPGYIMGIWIGTLFLSKKYSLGKSQTQNSAGGYVAFVLSLVLLALLLLRPDFIFFSEEGPASMVAPLALALGAGLIVGVLAQRTRLCTIGAIRDIILFKDFHLFSGLSALFVAAFLGNILTGNLNIGFADQPVAHNAHLWNFAGLFVVGWAGVLAGGCPMRQLILSSEGQGDALITVFGMIAGAAFMHNFGMAASPAGVEIGGQIIIIVSVIVLLAVGFTGTKTIAAGANR